MAVLAEGREPDRTFVGVLRTRTLIACRTGEPRRIMRVTSLSSACVDVLSVSTIEEATPLPCEANLRTCRIFVSLPVSDLALKPTISSAPSMKV